jgi:hypothetical protein
VETDELVRVELELRELREEFSDDVGRVRVEAVLYGFQVDKEMVGIMLLRLFLLGIAEKCRHERRDSVTQARVEGMAEARRTGLIDNSAFFMLRRSLRIQELIISTPGRH